jgi:hypothetical protein
MEIVRFRTALRLRFLFVEDYQTFVHKERTLDRSLVCSGLEICGRSLKRLMINAGSALARSGMRIAG